MESSGSPGALISGHTWEKRKAEQGSANKVLGIGDVLRSLHLTWPNEREKQNCPEMQSHSVVILPCPRSN